jgi:excisionase family DNA binding protein
LKKIPCSEETRLLYDRKTAALQLSVSVRTLDYFVANKRLTTRRIGKKVMIPRAELVRFARADHFGPVNISPDYEE